MSALKKIRENVGLVIIVISISLFAFVFVDLVKNIGTGPENEVATVNGKSVAYEALDAKRELAERNAREMETQTQRDEARQQAWDNLVREILFRDECEKVGLMVTDEELSEMYRGALLHPAVANSGYFGNPRTGQQYDPVMVDSVFAFLDQIDLSNPNESDQRKLYKLALLDMREAMLLERLGTKWQVMIAKAMLVSDNELNRSYNEESRTANISYVSVPYASIDDATVNVSESDFSEYYSKNKARFKRETEAKIKYTFFLTTPSPQDSADTRDVLNKSINDFRMSAKPFEYALSSGDASSVDTIAKPVHELPAAVLPILGRTDTVVGPVRTDGGYALYRIARVEEDSTTELNKVRHILLAIDPADSNAAKTKATEIQRKLQGDSAAFTVTAMSESKDNVSSGNGGNLGWIATSKYGPDFDKAVKNASVGSVFTVKTPAGIHVVQVTDRTRKRYAVATLFHSVTPSQETNEVVYKRAAGYLGEILGGGDMDAALANYPEGQTRVTSNITQSTYTLLGLENARPVITWAFYDKENRTERKKGDITTELIEVGNAMVVARVEYIGEKGYKALEDIKEEIRPEVVRWVKAREIKKKLGQATGDLQAIASAYGPGATVGTAQQLIFANDQVPGLGAEPKVVGRAFGLKPNEVSKPIAGTQGVYVVRLDAVQEPAAPIAPEMLAFRRMNAKQQKASSGVNASFQGLIDAADIHDYRARFDF